MDIEIRNLYNRLRFQWRTINEEFKEISSINNLAFSEFYNNVIESCKKNNLKNPFQEKEEEVKEQSGIYDLEETKKIFREIAIKTHPDKNKSNDDLFKNLVESKKEQNINKLFDNAKKTKVKVAEISYEHIEKMEEEIKDLKDKIKEIRTSIHWNWYHEKEKNKNKIILNIIKNIKNDKEKNKENNIKV